MSGSTSPVRRPPALVAVAVIEGLEALALLGIAVLSVIAGASSPYPQTTYGVAGTFAIAAVLLAFVAVGTFRARTWSRTPGLVWQVVQALIGFAQLTGQGPNVPFALAAIVPGVVVIALLLTRSVREATARSTGA